MKTREEQKAGLWLSEVYIVDADTDQPYVWTMGKDKKLEKRSVILGQYDEELGEHEIADGLTKDDYIAYPSENLKEGMATTKNREEAVDLIRYGRYGSDFRTWGQMRCRQKMVMLAI